jgi:transcriptional regulator with XRE-family HTH domain
MQTQTFGQWIRARRQTRGWTITRCAERADMKWQAWQRLENDEPRRRDGSLPQPTRRTVERIAHALDVPRAEALRAAGYLADFPPNAIFIPAGGQPAQADGGGGLSTEVRAELARMQAQIDQILRLLQEMNSRGK